jgi:hypothetical protein
MSLQELMNGIVGILQVGELPSTSWTVFAASSGEPFGDAVIA